MFHAAILAGGYSSALGFIHTGKQLSFGYDVADLYKANDIIPLAFAVAARSEARLGAGSADECRPEFTSARLMERILPDIAQVLAIPQQPAEALAEEYDEDARTRVSGRRMYTNRLLLLAARRSG